MSEKAQRFHGLQFRSVLDAPEASSAPDATWASLLASGSVVSTAVTQVQLALPETTAAETCFVGTLDALIEALQSPDAFLQFHRQFGWATPEEYFESMGSSQLMVVDVDHNDSDDRLAIVILAYQMASANAQLRLTVPDASCTLLLDARTYAADSGLCMWRTLLLVTRLRKLLSQHGLSVEPVLGDRSQVLQLVANYLQIPAEASALDDKACGTGSLLQASGPCGSRVDLCNCWPAKSVVSVWVLGGLCASFVDDCARCSAEGVRFVVFEQAQPAWQSNDVGETELQPSWAFPPSGDANNDLGYGAEPSNARSSAAAYPETLQVYMRFQKLVETAPASFQHVFPALSRKTSYLPAPPGQKMLQIHGRPLNVRTGTEYEVKYAQDAERLTRAFSNLLSVAKKLFPDTLYEELIIDCTDDFGESRPSMRSVQEYGTYMADAIAVCLAAKPLAALGAQTLTRRLAIVKMAAL